MSDKEEYTIDRSKWRCGGRQHNAELGDTRWQLEERYEEDMYSKFHVKGGEG